MLRPATHRISECMLGWKGRVGASEPVRIGVVRGQGIGPEVVAAALTVLAAVSDATRTPVEVVDGGIPWVEGPYGYAVGDEGVQFFDAAREAAMPVLCGPVGGRFVYEVRQRWALYCKIVPVVPLAEIRDASIVRPDQLADVDLLIVRDNDAGLYQGRFGTREGGRVAYQEATYSVDQVDRILGVAIRAAASRSGRLTVVSKIGGVPTIGGMWRDRAHAVDACGVEIEHLEVDNVCYQVIADPRRFDVLVTPNMLGDIVADTAAIVLGSRGMALSANFGDREWGVYQTGHGSAHDLAGSDSANPVGQIQSLALLLRESLGLVDAADLIERAIRQVLGSGLRTADIAGPDSTVVSTGAMGDAIAVQVRSLADELV